MPRKLSRFWELFNYYRRFVDNFENIAKSLT